MRKTNSGFESEARRFSNGEPADGGAEAIYFLAGERAAFITGQVLSVNGGIVIG